MSEGSLTFAALGDTARVTAIVRDQNGETMTGVAVTWSSSSGSVASVSSTGLVMSTGNGNATISASAGNAESELGVAVSQVPVRLRFSPDPVTLENVEDTVTVVATIVDANENPMPPEPVTWVSNAPDTVEVSDAGLVRAVTDGRTFLAAMSGGVSGELAAFVGDEVVVIGSVSPSPMIVGAEAVVRGLGFSPVALENVVELDGFPAEVTSASSVELRIVVPDADCSPPRQGELAVAARGMNDTTEAAVRPEVLESLAVGEGAFVVDGCIHLGAGNATERYLVGILSSSEVPSSLTAARLASRAGSRLVAAPARQTSIRTVDGSRTGTATSGGVRFSAPPGPSGTEAVQSTAVRAGPALDLEGAIAARPDQSGEADIRAAERAWLATLGGATPSLAGPATGPLRAPPNEGETLDLTVPESCDAGTDVRAVVRHVGNAAAFLEDIDNPMTAFTDAQYEDLDAQLAATTLPVLRDYFGDFADVDDNERVLVLLTKEVNERENLAGFVFSGDLVSPVSCANSNEAEIFYGLTPDTAGVHGTARTRESLLVTYPPLIAHELTHILQFTTFFRDNVQVKSTWELEGGATLAEQLVGYDVLGHGPRQNLGFSAWEAGQDPDWYRDWVVDMALYFGFKGEDPPEPNAPEQCSWVGLPPANDGPCENQRAVYGVPSMLLRWVLDENGTNAEDDAALMTALTGSSTRGLENLEQTTGEDRVSLLVRFGASLWADDRPGLGNWIPSWNVFDIFEKDNINPDAQLRPYTRTGAEPTLDVLVRAASNAYLLWTPPELHDPTSLRIRTQVDNEPLPEHMVLWVLRIQ
ncbi:MAG: Ig-like domain-containing protein [Gemmatimonadota bacterium]